MDHPTMEGGAERFLDLVYRLEDLTDEITPEQAHAEFDQVTLQLFWKRWPHLSAWAGSLFWLLSEELANPAEPQGDPELDEVGGSD